MVTLFISFPCIFIHYFHQFKHQQYILIVYLIKFFTKYISFCLIDINNTKYFLHPPILSKCAKNIMLNYNLARPSDTNMTPCVLSLSSKWCQSTVVFLFSLWSLLSTAIYLCYQCVFFLLPIGCHVLQVILSECNVLASKLSYK